MRKDKVTFYAQKQDGDFLAFERPQDVEDFHGEAPAGRYTVEYKRAKKKATGKQRGVIFGLMIDGVVEQAKEKTIGIEDIMKYLLTQDLPKGVEISKDYLHALMYIICPTFDEEGNQVTLSKMNTEQANDLFERFRDIMAGLNIQIPDPDPNWNKDEKMNTDIQ